MLSVAEAQDRIMQRIRPLPPRNVPLGPDAVGLVLAEDVASDLDMPPFDKALMDGYAVRAADVSNEQTVLAVIEEVMAGQTPGKELGAGQATRIMTGAPLPAGSDAVVMVERTRALEGGRVQIDDRAKPGQNLLERAREMRRGEIVLRDGTTLRPQEFGLLAAVGRTSARVHPAPRVAILPTGDEIVDVGAVPGPGQIRNSNAMMLLAQVVRAGGVPRNIGIAYDRLDHLRQLVDRGLEADVLVLSGGVSAGERDLVPGVLAEAGVEAAFHKVAMKPGKPMLFGVKASPAQADCPKLVFGLPGNPVSSLVCFELFVRPALRKLRGDPEPGPSLVPARLEEDFNYRSDRPTYYPALLRGGEQGWRVKPVPWFGSADLRGLLGANAFVLLPPGDNHHKAGQTFPVLKVE